MGKEKKAIIKPDLLSYIHKISINEYLVFDRKDLGMQIPLHLISDRNIIHKSASDGSIKQGIELCRLLPDISKILILPDIQPGFGIPIGTVVATDPQTGIVPPYMLGTDIGCGVLFFKTSLYLDDLDIPFLADVMTENIPRGKSSSSCEYIEEVLDLGIECPSLNVASSDKEAYIYDKWTQSYPFHSKLFPSKQLKLLSEQLGSLGGGNHFAELSVLDKIKDRKICKYLGLYKGMVVGTVHTGSRSGGGYVNDKALEVAHRYTQKNIDKNFDKKLSYFLPTDPYYPTYVSQYRAMINFSQSNRYMISRQIIKSIKDCVDKEFDTFILSDSAHNIWNQENQEINNKKSLCSVFRKGANKAIYGGDPSLSGTIYHPIGYPILIPGDAIRGSYFVLPQSTNKIVSMESIVHGSGRNMSRKDAVEIQTTIKEIRNLFKAHKVETRYKSEKSYMEEASEVYKNIEDVMHIMENLGLVKIICKLKPIISIKN